MLNMMVQLQHRARSLQEQLNAVHEAAEAVSASVTRRGSQRSVASEIKVVHARDTVSPVEDVERVDTAEPERAPEDAPASQAPGEPVLGAAEAPTEAEEKEEEKEEVTEEGSGVEVDPERAAVATFLQRGTCLLLQGAGEEATEEQMTQVVELCGGDVTKLEAWAKDGKRFSGVAQLLEALQKATLFDGALAALHAAPPPNPKPKQYGMYARPMKTQPSRPNSKTKPGKKA